MGQNCNEFTTKGVIIVLRESMYWNLKRTHLLHALLCTYLHLLEPELLYGWGLVLLGFSTLFQSYYTQDLSYWMTLISSSSCYGRSFTALIGLFSLQIADSMASSHLWWVAKS